MSRAELTRLTGLNRSTVGALVGELAQLGLVAERAPDATKQVGRPSPMVMPNASVVAFGVNPEIDAVTVGVVGLGGRVHERIRVETDGVPTAEQACRLAAAAIGSYLEKAGPDIRPVSIGVAVPGLVRAADGLVRQAPRLAWVDEPVSELLEGATGLPVSAANDASLGANAERIFGAGRGVSDLIYLNGGASGIGAGVVAGGRMLEGVAGFAGEIGHVRVGGGRSRDSAGLEGTLESEVTRQALLDILGLASADAAVLERALLASGDAAVRAEVERQLGFVGAAIGAVVNIFNPELIVLGGFLGTLYEVAPAHLDAAVAASALPVVAEGTRIARAELGSDLLSIAAAELAFTELLADPAGGMIGLS